jgi:hypothetical protein
VAITTWAELQTEVGDLLNYGDSAAKLQQYIALCEADLQVKVKLLEFEATNTVTITDGSGTLPTGFLGARSVYWDDDTDHPLTYITPAEFDRMRLNDSGDGHFYTISGSTIRTTPMGSGSVVITHMAKFTPLSGSATSNALLASFPNAYLYGSAMHGAILHQDDAATQKFGLLFNGICERINQNNEDRKYAGPLAVRPQ